MFSFFKKAAGAEKVTDEDKKKVQQLLLGINGAFNWSQYEKDTYPIDNEGRSALGEIRQHAAIDKTKEKTLSDLIELSEKYTDWVYVYYELALTYVLLGDTENAYKNYQKVLEFESRGFYSAITENYIIKQILGGAYDHAALTSYIKIFDTPVGSVKEELCKKFIAKYPDFGPIYIELIASQLINHKLDEAKLTIEEARELHMDPDSRVKLQVLEIASAVLHGEKSQIKSIMENVLRLDTSRDIDKLIDFIQKEIKNT